MVRLAAMPGADVIVTPGAITPAGKVSIAPASLTFTALNYATQQSFTVTAQTDPDATDETLDFSLSATGGFVGSRAVRVTIIDNTFICNTTTCNAGCCLDNVCYPDGQADPFHCGAGAQMCQICGGTEFCNSGICLPM